MDERAFEGLAARMLADLADRLEDALGDAAEVELRGGILTIDCAAGGQFVVNKHAPNREIWLSSPVSGATHFARRGEEWISTRGTDRFADRLTADLADATGVRVDLG